MAIARNPILRGFNPDPSIIRVGEDYYIATSTFEWFPGVQIHHSRDLVNWNLVARPLSRVSQLDMLGVPDSCGVWAPCLSYHDGIFYLVYSNVKSFDGVWKDTPNYLVTTDDILGEWSEPVFLSSAGFDGSLFHDEDGRKWYSSLLVDHRKGKFFGGIQIQEYDPDQKKLVGDTTHIFEGTELGITEGPHLYRIGDYYYLITAEGGTEYGHAVSVARSKEITGPYEVHPDNPLVTSRNHPEADLQKTGHGDIFQTAEGDWYVVFLCGRPLSPLGRCTLGRETAIGKVEWKNDWPYLADSPVAKLEVEVPEVKDFKLITQPEKDDFDSEILNLNFQSLRVPITEDWATLKERPGWLRLYGRDSLSSFHHQSLLGRRVQAFNVEVSTCVEFLPDSFQQMAGLVCYYNTCHFYYLNLSWNEQSNSRTLSIIVGDKSDQYEIPENPLKISNDQPIYLKVHFNRSDLQFYYGYDGQEWIRIGEVLDGSILSDDYVRDEENKYRPAFTGSFVGLCCQDLSGNQKYADFDWFNYTELK